MKTFHKKYITEALLVSYVDLSAYIINDDPGHEVQGRVELLLLQRHLVKEVLSLHRVDAVLEGRPVGVHLSGTLSRKKILMSFRECFVLLSMLEKFRFNVFRISHSCVIASIFRVIITV